MKPMKLEIRNAELTICEKAPIRISERDRNAALQVLRDCLQCLPVGPASEVYNTILTLLEQGGIGYELLSVQDGIPVLTFAYAGDRSAVDGLIRSVGDPLGRKILYAFTGRELYLQLTQDQPFPVFLLSERLFASLKASRRRTNDGDGVADGFNQQLGKAA